MSSFKVVTYFIYLFGHTMWPLGSQFPGNRLNLHSLQWKHGILTTGLPGKSPVNVGIIYHLFTQSSSLSGLQLNGFRIVLNFKINIDNLRGDNFESTFLIYQCAEFSLFETPSPNQLLRHFLPPFTLFCIQEDPSLMAVSCF